ncbi:hypothetical protein J437_LFUL005673 [Ladona fulva]|uniref:C2H2-type domain-containing protein n=1 Tax=Ladona fulva TaxID=123851 RepID=A0A8K0K327_LADFU|nr:hypothetical protein J437_LFUL005673 [Ladona fulva]
MLELQFPRHSGKFCSNDKQKAGLFKGSRWVKNVLLVDIRKAGLLPPDCGDGRVSKEPGSQCDSISKHSAVDIERQNSNESIEEYVTVARSGKCFVVGCSFITKSFVSLLYHVLRLHKEVDKFSCLYCSHTCALSGMVEHLNMHGPTMFQCKYCPHHHFSQLKVREHIKLKHVGCPLVVVELRDFKEEEEDCDTTGVECSSEVECEDVEVVECVEEYPVIMKEEPKECEDPREAEGLENSEKADDHPKNSNSEFDNNCGDLSSSASEPKRLKMNEGNESLNELNITIDESKLVEGNDSISNCGDLDSSKGEIKRSKGKSAYKSKSKTNSTPKSPAIFFDPVIAVIEKKINLKSTAHNYHSSELELKKDALEKNWQCGLCDFVGFFNNMIVHAESAHEVKYQFQCSKCLIFIASRGYVESHCLIFHPKSLVTLIANYYLPGSSLPFTKVIVLLPDGQEIFTPDKPIFSHKIPEVCL